MMLDIQVNGYAGTDFNASQLTVDEVIRCCEQLRADGTPQILATIITGPSDWMVRRVTEFAQWLDRFPELRSVIRGLHIEGPFLNPATGYIGAHPKSAAQRANIEFASRIIEAGCGTIRLWTLAPEMDEQCRCITWLAEQGVVVAGGHSDASLDQLRHAIDSGMRLFTHLGNGCPGILPRHDNIIQRVLSFSEDLYISWIADGHHVPFFALKNYLRCVPEERIIIVSDAMAAAGLGPGTYPLAGQIVTVDNDLAAWGEGRQNFAGSATSLPQMRQLLEKDLGVTPTQWDRWTQTNPTRLLGI